MKNIALISLILAIAPSLYAEKIRIYHTSDVHGWYMSKPAKWDKENSTRIIGGFAVLSSMLKNEKNPYILLDSGDMFQGTPEGNFTKGEATVKYMNALKYSAATIGNHDYDYGENNLEDLSKKASFSLLGANIYNKKDGKRPAFVKPYVIVEKNGKKIAILGLAGAHTRTSTLPSNVKHLDFKDEAAEAGKYTEEILKLNPDAIVIMPHIGIAGKYSQQKVDLSSVSFEENEIRNTAIEVARAAKKADVVLGGHNHTGLTKGYRDTKTNTLLCESYWGLTDVTRVDLDFDDKTNKLKSSSCELIPLWADLYQEDAEILKITEEISAQVNKEMDKPLGKALTDIGSSKETLDTQIGNWMTDVMREYTKADFAFQNSAGIRNVINKGEIKVRDVFQVMPFENTLVKLTMTGEQVKNLISDNLRANRTGMQISGLTVKYSLKDEKIADIILEKDGKPINLSDKFKVTTNNYLTSGGSGGKAFLSAEETSDTMIPVREALIEHIKNKKEISSPETNRFIKIN